MRTLRQAGDRTGRIPGGILRHLSRPLRDRRGVGAIEFAIIAPILITLYIGSLELSLALSINKKVSRAAATVGDLVTQEQSTNKAALAGMVDVAKAVITPFNNSEFDLRITGIAIESAGRAVVDWSYGNKVTVPYAENSTVDIPDELRTPGSYLVRTELAYVHAPLTTWNFTGDSDFTAFDMRETYFNRPRISDTLDCTDC